MANRRVIFDFRFAILDFVLEKQSQIENQKSKYLFNHPVIASVFFAKQSPNRHCGDCFVGKKRLLAMTE